MYILHSHLYIYHPIFSLFSTRRCKICRAFNGVSPSRPSSSSTFLASSLSLNARSLASLSVTPDPSTIVGRLSNCIPCWRASNAAEPPGIYRSMTLKRAEPSWANCAAPRVVKDWRSRMLLHSKSWSLERASRHTLRKQALDRARVRKSKLRLSTARGSSNSGVMDRADGSSSVCG